MPKSIEIKQTWYSCKDKTVRPEEHQVVNVLFRLEKETGSVTFEIHRSVFISDTNNWTINFYYGGNFKSITAIAWAYPVTDALWESITANLL